MVDEQQGTVASDPTSREQYLKDMIHANSRDDRSFLEKVNDAHNEVLAEFSKYWHQLYTSGPSMVDGLKEFIKAIDWSEKWIQGIIAVQACILLTLVIFRHNMAVQNTFFILSVVIIYKADVLNEWGAQHWEEFSKYNYFEQNGAFVSLFISLPLLIGMLLVLINYAAHFIATLAMMKAEQIKLKQKKSAKKTQ